MLLFAAMMLAPAADADLLAVVQKFLDALGNRNAALMRAALMPEGRYHTVTGAAIGGGAFTELIERLTSGKPKLLERIWEPRVMRQDGLAVVWAPYDFHRDGQFSHCGVDTFTLVRAPEGWKISSLAYTIQRTGCKPSPLGAP